MKSIQFNPPLKGKWHNLVCLIVGAVIPEIGSEGWHSLILLVDERLERASPNLVEITLDG